MSTATEQLLELRRFWTPGVIVFSGRPKGEAVRTKVDLDTADKDDSLIVRVIVPAEVVSLNSSFFLGLFAPSVRLLGEQKFREKYVFEGPQEIREDVDDGIAQALRESNPLSKA